MPAKKKAAAKAAAKIRRGKVSKRAEKIDKAQMKAVETGQSFFIVGVGASAGGLDAFEKFFGSLPADTGAAYVVIAHLDPTHVSILPELIQRYNKMHVHTVADGMTVEPNSIYVIPPNASMAVILGCLRLFPKSEPYGSRMPIDGFFRSLAEDRGQYSIGVILSGAGNDGTMGLKAIRDEGGYVLVQDVHTAKYDGMPSSAIAAGLPHHILPPALMPERIINYIQNFHLSVGVKPKSKGETNNSFRQINSILRAKMKTDFSLYKENTVRRRIERRMAVYHIGDMEEYISYLEQNPEEVPALFKELLIGVTNFFRDPQAFEVLKKKVIPNLLKEKKEGEPIRIWVPACSSGEEAYSLAMAFQETLDHLQTKRNIQIYGTDIDKNAIDEARKGTYSSQITSDVSADRLKHFFLKTENGFRVRKEIREMLVFAVQNVIQDPPFIHMDMISCRNLLIYLQDELQRKVIPILHYSLNTGGYLMLGYSETIGGFTNLFTPLDKKWKIFQCEPSRHYHRPLGEIAPIPPMQSEERKMLPAAETVHVVDADYGSLVRKLLLDNYGPPCVIINPMGDIIYVHGRISRYLQHGTGKISTNVLEMSAHLMKVELGSAIRQASTRKRIINCKDLRIEIGGQIHNLSIKVIPIKEPRAMRGQLIVLFEDKGPIKLQRAEKNKTGKTTMAYQHLSELERELKITKRDLQNTIEELQSTNEELRASNEEMQSSNEELQSTNEELETSKEELQSMNEELVTVNTEYQNRVEQLARANDDMKNFLDAASVGVLFLDNNLAIARFTAKVTEIFNLIAADIGRPINHLTSTLKNYNLVPDCETVMRTLIPVEREIENKDARTYAMKMQPYRTTGNKIDGLVITFLDITERKEMERKIEISLHFAQSIVETVREPLLVLDENLKVITASKGFYKTFHVKEGDTERRSLKDLGEGQWKSSGLQRLLENILADGLPFDDYVVELEFPSIGRKKMMLNARLAKRDSNESRLILLAFEDITPSAVKETEQEAG